MTTAHSLKYKVGDIVCWDHDSERVGTGTVVSYEGSLYMVEIHFNPGLHLELPEDLLHPVDTDVLREMLEALQAALETGEAQP
jgi:hypothetical protein